MAVVDSLHKTYAPRAVVDNSDIKLEDKKAESVKVSKIESKKETGEETADKAVEETAEEKESSWNPLNWIWNN